MLLLDVIVVKVCFVLFTAESCQVLMFPSFLFTVYQMKHMTQKFSHE